MFVELHMIQNFAPSCLNRDDTNTPKDCEFGGHRRARISSQCIKRSVRWHPAFAEVLGCEPSLRTKKAKAELMERLSKRGLPEEETGVVLDAFVPAALTALSGDDTKVLLFLGRDELNRMEERIVAGWAKLAGPAKALLAVPVDNKKAREKAEKELAEACAEVAKGVQSGTKAADVALFGRMVAEKSDLKEIDAACQVAHAISTHKVLMDMDFYTAVDDLQRPEDEPGAGMMGEVEFNSSCFYRYALVDTNQLVNNLQGDTDLAKRAVEAFIRASVAAIPTGKQNSFAAQNTPALVLGVVRESGSPWSLANAFERPVRIRPHEEESLSDLSIRRLDKYWGRLESVYGADGIACKKAVYLGLGDVDLENVDTAHTLNDVVSAVLEAIKL